MTGAALLIPALAAFNIKRPSAATVSPPIMKASRMTTPFESVSRQDFLRVLNESAASPLFRQRFARTRPRDEEELPDYAIHRGDLRTGGHFEAPAFWTLITGSLHVDGIVDLCNPHDKGFDEGGLFIVLGDLVCNAFFNEYGKCSFIDGNLEARDLLLNDFDDSTLVVTGNLTTRFFYGQDMWAEVGGRASMEYGVGHCLPIGYRDAAAQAIRPRHDPETSRSRLNLATTRDTRPGEFRDHLLAGRPLLRE
jgi:hypothetical protein